MCNPTNKEDFVKAVKEDLTDRLSDLYPGIQIEHTYVEKAQGESYEGIRLQIPGQVAEPVMNVEPFYEKVTTSVPYREVIEDMNYYAQKALTEVPEISTEQLTNYMEMKDRLTMKRFVKCFFCFIDAFTCLIKKDGSEKLDAKIFLKRSCL